MEETDHKQRSPFGVSASATTKKNENAGNLVGRIVEKGFSNSTTHSKPSFPTPSILPFPVARHRSHPPHWASSRIEIDDEDVAANDAHETNYGPIAAFAQTIPRKQKKGLNFGSWRELVPEDSLPVKPKAKTDDSDLMMESGGVAEQREASGYACLTDANGLIHNSVENELCPSSAGDLVHSPEPMAIDSAVVHPDLDQQRQTFSSAWGSFEDDRASCQNAVSHQSQGSEQGSLSLLDDIDAENRVRIQNMSPEEIAEAQAEIIEKMPAEFLAMLKKRGHEKLGQTSLKSDKKTAHQSTPMCNNQDSTVAPPLEGAASKNSHGVQTRPTNYTYGGQQTSGLPGNTVWHHWTLRVEKIRSLRFSLDGSVVGSDNDPAPTMKNTSEYYLYNIENVSERDFLRTEGDPAGAGYTIKEAVALIRSVIPGQRVLSLQLLASVLDKASYSLQQSDVRFNMIDGNGIDWQAIWAFVLGPDPELGISLRMSLDDNHISVVLACAKVIQCILSCDMNESFFNISEKLNMERDICTAPVFRSKKEISCGFLSGGFWKFSTKPSNILSFYDELEDDENEGKRTIQDDNIVAGQDVTAGLIRMGILPRIRYLLEMEPLAALEECVLTILIGLSRHSKTSAAAVMRCPRLVQTVVNRFIKKETLEVQSSLIKSVTLLKVLAQSDKKNCEYFINRGIFHDTMRHFYRYNYSIDQWIKSGNCKRISSLMVEQLCFWKVCIRYGYCISHFTDIFPTMCLWLSPPSFEKVVANNVHVEYASITREAYATLEALAKRLPPLHVEQLKKKTHEMFASDMDSWSWSHAVPMVELALEWIDLNKIPYLSSIFSQQRASSYPATHDSSISCMLWAISSVMHMLCSVFERITSEGALCFHESRTHVPWLPEFVPKIALEIVKSGWFNFSDANCIEKLRLPYEGESIVQKLCCLRYHNDYETSLASVRCLHGLVCLVVLADKYIQSAKSEMKAPNSQFLSREDKILADGMVALGQDELRNVLVIFMNLVSSEWHAFQSVEMFGRGGPAPGIGIGWGACGGGFWSKDMLLVQVDAQLAVCLLEIIPLTIEKDLPADEDIKFSSQRMNSALGACLVAGPRDEVIVEKALDVLFQLPVLKFLDFCVRHFLSSVMGFRLFSWEYKDDDFLLFSKILNSHFRSRWLTTKKRSFAKISKETINTSNSSEGKRTLETIDEDMDLSEMNKHESDSLVLDWAHQRLPLPTHWFLSPLSTMGFDDAAYASSQDVTDLHFNILDVAKSGLFLLLGLEAVFLFACSDVSHPPVLSLPLVWKFHALSSVLLIKMDVYTDEKSRDTYETLQELYGNLLDKMRCQRIKPIPDKGNNISPESENEECAELLKFKTDIYESYTDFVENLIEEFSAISYGDEIYGRQLALYLHRSVEAPVRLAAWNALSNSHTLDLLPPIEKCIAEAEGYLEPIEDNEKILEAYTNSWVSGSLDKAAIRGSMSFRMALHHLSSFVFRTKVNEKLSFRKKMVRNLLRDYSYKSQRKEMMLVFVRYNLPDPEVSKDSSTLTSEIGRRLELLSEACEGNSSLLIEVERLKSSI